MTGIEICQFCRQPLYTQLVRKERVMEGGVQRMINLLFCSHQNQEKNIEVNKYENFMKGGRVYIHEIYSVKDFKDYLKFERWSLTADFLFTSDLEFNLLSTIHLVFKEKIVNGDYALQSVRVSNWEKAHDCRLDLIAREIENQKCNCCIL